MRAQILKRLVYDFYLLGLWLCLATGCTANGLIKLHKVRVLVGSSACRLLVLRVQAIVNELQVVHVRNESFREAR